MQTEENSNSCREKKQETYSGGIVGENKREEAENSKK